MAWHQELAGLRDPARLIRGRPTQELCSELLASLVRTQASYQCSQAFLGRLLQQ